MRRLVIALLAACSLALPAGASAASGFPEREADPVVITGASAPALLGAPPGTVVAFSYDGGWRQVPVQVDERAVVDYRAVRQTTGFGPFSHLAYTDDGTFAGPDPNPALDADDEIAAMAFDTGDDAAGKNDPGGVAAGSRVRVSVADPLQPGVTRFLYLFRSDSGLDPAAGRSYVDYDFSLNSGDYKTTYAFNGLPDGGSAAGGDPANPENSTVNTDFYREHLLDRWLGDAINVRAGSATGVDILDGDKAQVNYGCGRSEVTFSRGGGGFITNKSGPVRAIRSYIGANSGTYTQREHVYYQRSEVTTTYLRVHPGISTISQFLDYSPAASGMTYRNSAKPGYAVINGVPDAGFETGNLLGPAFTWEQVSGGQGTLSIVNRLATNMPGVIQGAYYQDDTTPTTEQCNGYADTQLWGASGPAVTGTGQNTDPTLGAAYDFTATRSIFFSAPGGDAALAARRSSQVDSPLQVSAGTEGGKVRLRVSGGAKRVAVGERKRLKVRIENRGRAVAGPVRVCLKGPAELVAIGRCAKLDEIESDEQKTVRIKVRLRPAAAGMKSVRLSAVAKGDGVKADDGYKLKPA